MRLGGLWREYPRVAEMQLLGRIKGGMRMLFDCVEAVLINQWRNRATVYP